MIRLLGFLLKLGIVITLAVWAADRSGKVSIEWQDKVVETSTFLLVLAVAVVAFISYSTAKFFSYINHLPGTLRMRHRLSDFRKGERMLDRAVDALAQEKKKSALSFLRKAEKLLGPSQVGDLVRAQAGEAPILVDRGDYSSPFAWREAIEKHLQDDRVEEAWALARNFAERHPRLPLPKKMLFEVRLRQEQWGEAARMLDALREEGALPRREWRVQRAALLAEQARFALERNQAAEAFEYARQADRLHPGWIPALLLASRALAQQDKPREAASLIEKSWASSAHPQLGAVYLSLKTGKSDVKKAQGAENLARRVEGPASQMLLGEALFRAGIYAQARYTAAELAKDHPSREVFTLLSKISHGERNGPAAQEWQNKAAGSPLGEAWICTSCRQPHKHWQALCSACKAFNSLSWETQPALIAER
ncbi:MAG: hypothetical protein HY053_09525 [Proteobacteria bacterium]|nr:hypothetical protein [Pseudomonadota bacterium]